MAHSRIPQEVFDEVLSRTSIVDVVSEFVQLTKAGRNFKGLCPFHGENTPSFVVSPDKGIYKCFGCGMGGNAISFLSHLEAISFPQAAAKLAARSGLVFEQLSVLEGPRPAEDNGPRQKMYDALEFASGFFQYCLLHTKEGEAARDYLKGRGISEETIKKFGIGLAPALKDALVKTMKKNELSFEHAAAAGLLNEHKGHYYDRFKSRIMFPIRDLLGKTVGFSGRAYLEGDDGMGKYVNSPETELFIKNSLIYNVHEARFGIRRQNRVLLFEGFLDVISAVGAGFLESVATMGTALTQQHADQLRRLTDQIIICYDGDKAGQRAADKAIDLLLQKKFNVNVVEFPLGMDPDDYLKANGAEAFGNLITQAVPALDYRYLYQKRQFNLEFISHREQFKNHIFNLAKSLEKPTMRELLLKKLAEDIKIGSEAILKEFQNENPQVYKNTSFNNNKNEMFSPQVSLKGSSKYEKSEKMLIYYMLKDRDAAFRVEEGLKGLLNERTRRNIAFYILEYYMTNETMNLPYFLNLLDEEMVRVLTDILFEYESLPASPSAGLIEELISVVKDYVTRVQIENLKKQIRETVSIEEKMELLGKVSRLKQRNDR